MLAILRLINDLLAIWSPRHPHDQKIARLILVRVDPSCRAACGIHDPELHNGIWITGLGVGCNFQILVIRDVIDNRKIINRILIKSQVGKHRRVRTPPVSLKVTAAIQLFLVHPVEPAVENFGAAISGQATFSLQRNIEHVNVVVTHKANHATVWTKSFPNLFLRIVGHAHSFVAAKFVVEKIVGPVEEHPGLVSIQLIRATVCQFFRVLRS